MRAACWNTCARWRGSTAGPKLAPMRTPPLRLYNSPAIELWPARLLRARSNRDARTLALADWVLRRKADGRYLAARLPAGLMPLVERLPDEPGLEAALDLLDGLDRRGHLPPAAATLALDGVLAHLAALGLDPADYAAASGLALCAEPAWLELAGFDRWRRPLWLTRAAGRAWQRMRVAAADDGICLEAISGYRSQAYQAGIFARKQARGLSVEQILAVNAAPGFSEHHSGRAIDIGTPGEPAAEESFEATPTFAWLQARAGDFGFTLSYPRDNPNGIVYEPWHWCFHAGEA